MNKFIRALCVRLLAKSSLELLFVSAISPQKCHDVIERAGFDLEGHVVFVFFNGVFDGDVAKISQLAHLAFQPSVRVGVWWSVWSGEMQTPG